ncbi:Ig-like domain-containing protein [Amycolatopsis cynarae]|uniref:Ig-like domain-containing protein n=1 Tax=Amycolatopsis cynarae TaxID=2995223 RepID=A0ABY7B5N1_9PSEU|nr:Ig-like domain-containing protein [Amycolatopsis sp. HUAS 11-8]WAL66547.1 Ig-like domain-containing protein [Amycolatopsis sp. HUAS 11-8]
MGISVFPTTVSPGQTVQLQATITCAVTTEHPSGYVQFFDGLTQIDGNVPIAATTGQATSVIAFYNPTAAGTHSIKAVYVSDNSAGSCAGNTSPATPLTVTTSTLTLTTNPPSPVAPGTPITVTAKVSCTGVTTATGFVQFYDNNSAIDGPLVLDSTGTANLYLLSGLPVGSHTIRADYTNGNCPSTSQSTVIVVGSTSNVTVSTVPANPTAGAPVRLVAQVTCTGGTPTGTVQFYDNNVPVGMPQTVNSGTAYLDLPNGLTQGSHTIRADYSGNGSTCLPGSNSIMVNVGAAVCRTIDYTVNTGLSVTTPICLGPNARIQGSITISGSGSLTTAAGAYIGGSLTASGGAGVTLCGTTVSGPVSLSGVSGAITIGDPTAGCAGNQIYGPLSLTGNAGPIRVFNNVIYGSLTCGGNIGTATGTGNTVYGSRNCPDIM